MKRHGTTYCFGCKDFTHYFKPQEVKMKKKKCSEKNQTVLFVDQISRRFQNKNTTTKNNSMLYELML